MTGREHETIPVGPAGIPGVMLEEPCPKNISHGSRAHGHSRMPGVRLLNHVDGKHPDGIDAEFIQVHLPSFSPFFADYLIFCIRLEI